MSQALRDARRYEEGVETYIKPEDRPGFHLSARVGWMNDPNGFSYYMGQYHMFYQYHPYDSHWGPMHWGHAVSTDLLHWEYLPAALAPDRIYDRDGCFSGNAITLPDGRHMLMYTGIINEIGEGGKTQEVQTQNLAFGDGLDYEKYEGNPVLTDADLPEGGSKYAFRDPKPWRVADGTYRALIANDREGHGGQMLLFRSEDAIHWEFVKAFSENHYRLGRMWECPDFFRLDENDVLFVSPQDMLPEGFEYHNGNGTVCQIGTFDEKSGRFTPEYHQAIDYGIDFYALQSLFWNQLFEPGTRTVTSGQAEAFEVEGNDISLARGKMKYTWSTNDEGLISQTTASYDSSSKGTSSLQWKYSDFKPFVSKMFPTNQSFSIQTSATGSQKKIDVTIDMKKLKTDSDWEATTKVPAKYTPVNLKDVINKILKL